MAAVLGQLLNASLAFASVTAVYRSSLVAACVDLRNNSSCARALPRSFLASGRIFESTSVPMVLPSVGAKSARSTIENELVSLARAST
jgi:hypothetical protein